MEGVVAESATNIIAFVYESDGANGETFKTGYEQGIKVELKIAMFAGFGSSNASEVSQSISGECS